jgi:hypothetical protein
MIERLDEEDDRGIVSLRDANGRFVFAVCGNSLPLFVNSGTECALIHVIIEDPFSGHVVIPAPVSPIRPQHYRKRAPFSSRRRFPVGEMDRRREERANKEKIAMRSASRNGRNRALVPVARLLPIKRSLDPR